MPLEIGRLRGSSNAPGNGNLPQDLVRLPAAENSTLGVVSNLCALANSSVQFFYRSLSSKQWLRTVVSLDGLSIHSNVVPRDAYLDSGNCLDPHRCRGFSPVTEIEPENPSRNCRSCALKQQMMDEADLQMVDADQARDWLQIEDQVDVVTELYRDVHKITWRSGILVRKRFISKGLFKRELAVATAVSHPNLVHCFGSSRLGSDGSVSESHNESSDLFMECLNDDLQTFLKEAPEVGAPFPFHDRLNVLLQVAKAMKHLHESGFVHGDLKPQNVFLSRVELAHTGVQCYLVKVGDFGSTQVVDASFRAHVGTTNYTAPEVFKCRYHGAPPPQRPQKIDVFSFGVVAFQVLTGAVNLYVGYRPRNVPREVMNGIRPDLKDQGANLDGTCTLSMLTLAQQCWAENPEERPSFSEICDELNSSFEEHKLCGNICKNSEKRPSTQVCDEPNRRSKEHGPSGNLAKPKLRWRWWHWLKHPWLSNKPVCKKLWSPYYDNGRTQT